MPEIKKGNNSAKIVSGVTSFNIYRVDTISILKITKRNNSAKNIGGVPVANLCTLSDHALYLCQVS